MARQGGGYHSNLSVSSLPTVSSSYQQAHHHRRASSVRPLPSIPTQPAQPSYTVPRDLHRRRATNGARDMPAELKKVDAQKGHVNEAIVAKKELVESLDAIMNLLNVYVAGPDGIFYKQYLLLTHVVYIGRIQRAVEAKMDSIDTCLKEFKVNSFKSCT